MRHRFLRHNTVLLAATLAACASRAPVVVPAAPAEPVEPATVQLSNTDVETVAALLRMEDLRSLDPALATRALESPTAEVRARAALAVGRIGDRNGTWLVLRALQDSVASVRARAAFALGKQADTAATVMGALARAALHDRPHVAAEAVAAIGRMRVAAARYAVDSLLLRADVPSLVRQEALLAAWRLPRHPETTRLVVARMADNDAEVRWRAAYALRSFGAVAVPALVNALADSDERVRAHAARPLTATFADSGGMREQALIGLLRAVSDPHAHVRITALRLLPGYRVQHRTTPALIAALRDTDENVALTAAQALGEAADAAAGDALRATATDVSRSDGLRTAAVTGLLAVDRPAALSILTAWADSSRWILRYHAARSLGNSPWENVGTVLQRLARDQHYLVSSAALNAVRSAADSAIDLRALYIERLGAEHALVRAAAARGLARRNGVADFDVLLQAYDRARQDSIRDAALAVVEALGRLRTGGVAVEHSFFLRFPQPPADAALRRQISERIGQPPTPWTTPAPAERPLSFYTGIVQRWVAPMLAGGEPPRVAIETARGVITIDLAAADAPLTVHNFVTLIERGYFTGTRWHRVVPNFVIQDGDPRGDGSGGPGYTIRDEINPLRYLRGALGMAHSGPDTGGAQFFITHSPQPHLDGGYTIFGRVSAGMDVADRVVQEDPIVSFRIVR